jgi:hypothetical protein
MHAFARCGTRVVDAGDGAVAALEAFEDAGKDLPVMTGEDEMSFLTKWKETGIDARAPVYSNFQWPRLVSRIRHPDPRFFQREVLPFKQRVFRLWCRRRAVCGC